MSQIDQNEILAKVAVDSLEKSITLLSKSLDSARRKISVRFGAGFHKYKQASASRYGSVRTLLHRDKPIPLKNLYVETHLECGDLTYVDSDLIEKIGGPSRILVVGTAGGGKSMLMRFLNLVLTNSANGILPVFFELRSLNQTEGAPLLSSLVLHVSKIIEDIDETAFRSLLREGRIVLLLDGFDEIDHDKRGQYALEISELCRELSGASVIVSSRPDDLAQSIETFDVYRVAPFNKEQTVDLLGRLPYDPIVREKFISEVNRNLYDKHKDFLSNPLLITMMLMTYHQFAEIPSKVHIFYQQAFEALFSWHDSSKDVFKRKSYSDLPIDEFQRTFSYFCASSYIAQTFIFSSTKVRQLVSSAIDAEGVETSTELFLRDLLESTCLLQKEGVEIVFVHRSFQEYFTALFVIRLDPKSRKRALDSAAKRAHSDLVIPMAYEMSPAAIEKSWALPTVKSLIKKLNEYGGGDPIKTLSVPFEMISVSKENISLHWNIPKVWASRALALDKLYGFRLPTRDKDKSRRAFESFIEKLSNEEYREKVLYKGYYPKGFTLGSEPEQIFLKINEDISELFYAAELDLWSEALVSWLEQTRSSLESRVSSRNSSIVKLLG